MKEFHKRLRELIIDINSLLFGAFSCLSFFVSISLNLFFKRISIVGKKAMAMPGSPSSFTNGYEEDPIFQNSHYTQDISEQMRVPKRIKATGEFYDDFDLPLGGNNGTSNWGFPDKIDMTVPDRIMVIGQEQVLGKCV